MANLASLFPKLSKNPHSPAYHANINDKYLRGLVDADSAKYGRDLFMEREIYDTASLFSLSMDHVFRAATHFMRWNAKGYDKFSKTIDQVARTEGYELPSNFCKNIIIPNHEDAKTVIVYINMPITICDYDRMARATWLTRHDVLEPFFKNYTNDLKTDKSKAWTPFKRALRNMWKREILSVERALTRYTKLPDILNAAQIRDLGVAYAESITPIKLDFAETPKDFVTMLEGGPSTCMSNDKGKDGAWKVLFNHGLCPMSFYGFSPHAKGAYIKSGKTVAARTICLQNKDGTWTHGRVYSANPRYRTQILNALRDANIRPIREVDMSSNDALREVAWTRGPYTFEVDGVPTVGSGVGGAGHEVYAMPMPYLDNHSRNLHVTFDRSTKKFIVEVDSGKPVNVPTTQTVGFILSSRLETVECDACGGVVMASAAKFSQDGEAVFCSDKCVVARDYVLANRADGLIVIVHRDEAIKDAYGRTPHGHIHYTNMDAAKANNAFPYVSNLDERPEDGQEIITAHTGVIVKIGTEFIRLAYDDFDRLKKMGVVEPFSHQGQTAYKLRDTYVLDKQRLSQDIDVKSQKVVLIGENELPIDPKVVNEILASLN